MAPKKVRCTFQDCKDQPQRIAGDCSFCNGHFCGKHRLLEDHKCTGLDDVGDHYHGSAHPCLAAVGWGERTRRADVGLQCKKESHERNAARLESEKTQVVKGV